MQIDLKEDFAPRLGVVFDPSGDHTSKVFGSYGRYYEQIPMDLVIRSFSYERQPRIINFSPTSTTPDAAGGGGCSAASRRSSAASPSPPIPICSNQYINEFILGYEREVHARPRASASRASTASTAG